MSESGWNCEGYLICELPGMLPISLTEMLKYGINLLCRKFILAVWHLEILLDSNGVENILQWVTALKYCPLSMRDIFFKVYSQFISPTQPMERSELYMFWRLLFLVWLKGTIRSILLVLKPYSREHLSLVCLEEQQLLPSSCLVILKLHTVSLLSAEPVWTTN